MLFAIRTLRIKKGLKKERFFNRKLTLCICVKVTHAHYFMKSRQTSSTTICFERNRREW